MKPAFPVVLALVAGLQTSQARAAQSVSFSSPDRALTVTVGLDAAGGLKYSLSMGNRTVLGDSPLGIAVHAGQAVVDWSTGNTAMTATAPTIRQFRFPIWGMQSVSNARYRESVVTLSRPAGTLRVRLSLFDNGLAYRYEMPDGQAHPYDDETGWNIPNGSTLWSQPRGGDYEGLFTPSPNLDGRRVPAPVTIVLPGGGYAAISDSDVPTGQALLWLSGGAGSRVLHAESHGEDSHTPWRIVMASADLDGLVHGQLLVLDAATPPNPALFPQGARTPYIQPGRSLWSWLPEDTGSPELQHHYVDAASALGFEYILVDAGWEGWHAAGKDDWAILKDLVEYATAHHVRVWVWKHSNELKNGAVGPFFDKVKAAGAVGIKVDFIAEDIVLQRQVVQAAAERQLMINFHGPNKPAGLNRTYPNELTREAIRGLEYERGGGNYASQHQVAAPFVRMLAGPLDYTPGLFDNRLHTSFSFEVAAGIVYDSPVTHWGVSPETIDRVFPVGSLQRELFASIPTVWDETRVLPVSAIGKVAAIARRRGDTWYLGVMYAGDQPMPLNISLDFLQSRRRYDAVLLGDSPKDPHLFVAARQTLSRHDSIPLMLQANGGFAARFTPAR